MTTDFNRSRTSRLAPTLALLTLSTLSGCADFSGITTQSTLLQAPQLGLAAPATNTSATLDTQWWRAFDDDTLNQLEAQALQASPSLKLAQARLTAAQAATRSTDALSGPQLSAQANLTHQRYTANGAVPPPLAGSEKDSGTVQLAASWELDFFGKNQAALQAALGTERAAQADAQAARVWLSAQVAQTYLAWVGLNEQRAVAHQVLTQREQTLALVQARHDAGLDTPLTLRQTQGSLPEARLQLARIDEQLALTHNALAALVNEQNKPLALIYNAQTAIKKIALPSTLSTNLLAQRADVAAARWRVQAADSGISHARAQFYPDLNLTAFAGFSSIGLDQLLSAGSQQWGGGPALSLPLFDSGRLRANLGRQTAERDAAVESYNTAVVNAVHDALDQLSSGQAIAAQQAQQAQTAQAAEDALAVAQQRQLAGLFNALQVLSAQTAVLEQRRLGAELNTRAWQNQVALARALGGGFTLTEAFPP
ncbi:solvent efflux pump outer membrane protein SrpC [Rhodoferax lithotrophicus]|uniref:Solvent efflux pump outer membrane protein SrpC n=1 Tax=Rhodoferax lithotrophicus TaxID=2798804 RepID=A0ABM7MK97_9BURK|nr:efflux transporter outer membrane subunit [Rhodoferax sp. MIZ03]BCO26628.1 solvent efflux pump outer membrane protein SrpC [Rhodoferax sp. MIZ03]